MKAFKRCIQLAIFTALPSALVGCMMGPDFHAQKAPQVSRYTQTPLPKKTVNTPGLKDSGKTQRFVAAQEIPSDWWVLFHSPEINELVQRGIAHSPTLASAQATMRQAQETLKAQFGNLMLPAFNGTLSGQRQLFPGASEGNDIPSSLFNVFNANVSVSYTLDFFGANRRQLEALQAQVDYQQFQLIATYLTLTTNIVTTAITIAALESQITATHALINDQANQLNILKKQMELGGVSNNEVFTQDTLVNQTRATLPPLEKNLSQAKHALAVLVGEFPDQPMPNINLDKLFLPEKMPVSLPSQLVRQRPDVRASEALLHVASAQVGVATANLFPQFTLSGLFGWSSQVPSSLFNPDNKTWNYGGQLLQPIFHGGALFAQRRNAIAAYDAAAAQYRLTLLQAFQNVGDALRAIQIDATNLRATRAAEMSAQQSLKLTKQQYKLGGVNYLNLLNAQQQYQTTRIQRIQAQALRFADSAALFQALGGGWWNRCVQPCHDPINPICASMACPE